MLESIRTATIHRIGPRRSSSRALATLRTLGHFGVDLAETALLALVNAASGEADVGVKLSFEWKKDENGVLQLGAAHSRLVLEA